MAIFNKLKAKRFFMGASGGNVSEVTKTASQINSLVIGAAAGYKVARGNKAATATASVATGLTTLVGWAVSPRAITATKANAAKCVGGGPGVTAGTLKIWRWKHTAPSTCTLVAATTAGTVDWVAIGT